MKIHRFFQIMLCLPLMMFVAAESFAQQPDFLFEQQYPFEWTYAGTHSLEIRNDESETECYFVAACDLGTIGYLVGSKGLTRDNMQPAKVLKLSPEGELLGEMSMNEEGRYSSIIKLYHDPFNSKYCLACGVIIDSTVSCGRPYLAKFDLDLNMVWLKEIELPEDYCYLLGGRSLMDSNGDIVFCSWPLHVFPNGYSEFSNMLYLRLSPDGELLAMGESPFISWLLLSAQGDLFEYKDGSGDYGQTYVGVPEGFGNPPVFLVRMDRDFTDFRSKDLLENILVPGTDDGIFIGSYYSEAFTTSLLDGSKFMSVRGSRYDCWNPELWDEVIVSMKLDLNDSIVALSYIPHDNDSVRTLAFCHGMDGPDNGMFFICNGVYDPKAWTWYGEIGGKNHFEVAKKDADANIIWSRFYEDGEHVFQPCSVMSTSDGGCLVTGRCWIEDQSEAELFVLKFFADGSLSVPELKTFVRPYTFYPNPVKEQLRMQFSPDVQPTQMELYDLQGRLVRTQRSTFESIDLSRLPAGTYTMRVTFEDGKIYEDKVVKE